MTADRPSVWARGLSRRQLVGADVLLAAAYLLLQIFVAAGIPGAQGGSLDWRQLALSIVLSSAIATRRIWPMPAFCVALIASVLAVALGSSSDWFAAAALCFYLVALSRVRLPLMWAVACVAVGVVLFLPLIGVAEPGRLSSPSGQFVVGLVLLGAAWVSGQAVRERRQYIDWSAREQAERAVSEERLRIAREMHDIVAHSMSIVAVKAGVANHVMTSRPEHAREALTAIEAASREALTELRRMLGMLRSANRQETAVLEPTPGIHQIPALIDHARLAGLPADLDISGAPQLPEGVGLAVYRIVQESLTNVVKHADSSQCQVVVRGDEREVTVEVSDRGPGDRGPDAGTNADGHPHHGLIGMRERATAYGGTFQAGAAPSGGYRVHARIPFGDESP